MLIRSYSLCAICYTIQLLNQLLTFCLKHVLQSEMPMASINITQKRENTNVHEYLCIEVNMQELEKKHLNEPQ